MENISNSDILTEIIQALYKVAGRRTSIKFADETIGATLKTLEGQFEFLKYIQKEESDYLEASNGVYVSKAINHIDQNQIGKAIESMLRIVYNDMDDDGGLYFISELKKNASEEIIHKIKEYNVDLDQLQIEQHYTYRRKEKKKSQNKDGKEKPVNQLGYSWDNVGSWKHEQGSPYCTIFSKDGKIIDRLNLDSIIQEYVQRLSGYSGKDSSEFEEEINIFEKEYQLLELMYSRDMDLETAAHLLRITTEQINDIIRKLTKSEILHFTSFDEVTITEKGLHYLEKEKKEKE